MSLSFQIMPLTSISNHAKWSFKSSFAIPTAKISWCLVILCSASFLPFHLVLCCYTYQTYTLTQAPRYDSLELTHCEPPPGVFTCSVLYVDFLSSIYSDITLSERYFLIIHAKCSCLPPCNMYHHLTSTCVLVVVLYLLQHKLHEDRDLWRPEFGSPEHTQNCNHGYLHTCNPS